MQAVKPENLKDLLYEILALLNKGIDSEDLIQRQSIANLNLSKPFLGQAYDRQAGEMAFKNASFHAAAYHLKSAVSYFGISTWKLGNSRFVFVLSLAYERMFQAHLLLSEAILAEGDHALNPVTKRKARRRNSAIAQSNGFGDCCKVNKLLRVTPPPARSGEGAGGGQLTQL